MIPLFGLRGVAATAAVVQVLCHLSDPRIGEASGIATAQRTPHVAFVQNDSGDRNRFFAVDVRTGHTVATIVVPGAHNVDWEDIATGPDRAGTPSVWIADVGDNDAERREVQVYRVPEPRLSGGARDRTVPDVPTVRTVRTVRPDVWRLRYPSGATDAESFAVAPDGRGYLVTKSLLGTSAVYRLPWQPDPTQVQVLHRIGRIEFAAHGVPNPFGVAGELMATGAAFSRNGAVFAVRTYASAYLWRLAAGGLAAALHRKPTRIELPRQRQGEGITFAGRKLLVDSEGRHSAVVAVAMPSRLAQAAVGPRPHPAGSPGVGSAVASAVATGSTTPKSAHRNVGGIVAGVIVLLVVIGTAVLLQRRRRRRFGDDKPDEPR